ncbi:MAG: LacI family DNA-binding transcriptional regulator, partial [Propionibacteriaceae bacterium]
MATLKDVARLAGVSISAASRVLTDAPSARASDVTRERIRAAAAELNYRPNFAGRALKFSRTNVIALIVPDLTNAFLTELMLGVEDEAARRGYLLLLGRSEDTEPAGDMISRLIGEGRVDGMLLQANDDRTADQIQRLISADLPVVFMNSIEAGQSGGVILDDQAGAGLATRHLIELGHTDIAMIGGLVSNPTARRRAVGFRAAMTAAGLVAGPETVTTLGYYPHEGRAAIRALMSRPRPPTGIVVANVNAAIGALSEARRLALRVPEDLSLVSVHDSWTAENTWPPLTTVKMPLYDLGRAAVTALHQRLNGVSEQVRIVSEPPPQLVVRESTRRL